MPQELRKGAILVAHFTFFADESGHVTQEPGISDEVGPSQYLCMGGALIPKARESEVAERFDEIQRKFKKKKFLHAADINHVQKIYLIREILALDIDVFGIVSDKNTLGGFRTRSRGNPQQYYNRTALYLLNILGRHLRDRNIPRDAVEIVFERREHDYEQLQRYIKKVAGNPTGDDVDSIPHISASSIKARKKEDSHIFSVPDIIAHAVFSAFDRNRNNFGITESRYLRELLTSSLHESSGLELYLIQSSKMKNICQPTSDLLREHGMFVKPRKPVQPSENLEATL
ncbi:hypothetical protein M2324_000059 [Rhodovulum sulfidophilum]|nr:hypothetical protein [Rhodovulum sulfidophilum]